MSFIIFEKGSIASEVNAALTIPADTKAIGVIGLKTLDQKELVLNQTQHWEVA